MNKLKELQDHIEKVAEKCARDPKSIQLIIASKYFTKEEILHFYEAGIKDFGENRVQDFFRQK